MSEQTHLRALGWLRTPSGLWSHPRLEGIFHTDEALRMGAVS